MDNIKPVSEVVAHLKALAADSDSGDDAIVAAFRNDVPRVLDFVEKSVEVATKAHELLANAYSTQDSEGIRIQSEDARASLGAMVGRSSAHSPQPNDDDIVSVHDLRPLARDQATAAFLGQQSRPI